MKRKFIKKPEEAQFKNFVELEDMAPFEDSLRAAPEFALSQKLQIFSLQKELFGNIMIYTLIKDILSNFCANPDGTQTPHIL